MNHCPQDARTPRDAQVSTLLGKLLLQAMRPARVLRCGRPLLWDLPEVQQAVALVSQGSVAAAEPPLQRAVAIFGGLGAPGPLARAARRLYVGAGRPCLCRIGCPALPAAAHRRTSSAVLVRARVCDGCGVCSVLSGGSSGGSGRAVAVRRGAASAGTAQPPHPMPPPPHATPLPPRTAQQQSPASGGGLSEPARASPGPLREPALTLPLLWLWRGSHGPPPSTIAHHAASATSTRLKTTPPRAARWWRPSRRTPWGVSPPSPWRRRLTWRETSFARHGSTCTAATPPPLLRPCVDCRGACGGFPCVHLCRSWTVGVCLCCLWCVCCFGFWVRVHACARDS
jgi:hypothetical protein